MWASIDAMNELSSLVALLHVTSSQTRDQTSIPCLGRQILNHWTTKEVLKVLFLY